MSQEDIKIQLKKIIMNRNAWRDFNDNNKSNTWRINYEEDEPEINDIREKEIRLFEDKDNQEKCISSSRSRDLENSVIEANIHYSK